MAIKAIVQSLDGIPESLKGEYKPIEGGQGFALDLDSVEEHPRVGALKRAKDHEKREGDTARLALKEATERLNALTGEHETLTKEFEERLRTTVGSKEKDLERLDQSWGQKLQKATEEAKAQIAQRDAALAKVLVMDKAREIVANMNPAAPEYVDVILPHVVQRLTVELTSDGARTRVVDADGKPTADSVSELTEHFKVDKRFAPLLTGSRASGGSANGGNSGGAGSAGKIDLTKATLEEKAAYYKAKAGK